MAAREIELVFGGPHRADKAVADAVRAAGGRASASFRRGLVDRELAHQGLTSLRIVGSTHERKALMATFRCVRRPRRRVRHRG